MLGWSMSASACRSASNRAMTLFVSMPGLMIFNATRRRIGSSCSAMKTTPQPPSPTCCKQLVTSGSAKMLPTVTRAEIERLAHEILGYARGPVQSNEIGQVRVENQISQNRLQGNFQLAVMASAAAIIISHNHPSGDPTAAEATSKLLATSFEQVSFRK